MGALHLHASTSAQIPTVKNQLTRFGFPHAFQLNEILISGIAAKSAVRAHLSCEAMMQGVPLFDPIYCLKKFRTFEENIAIPAE